MTKQEFLQRLARLLEDVTREEREEALRYYEEYFDEAGPEQEQALLNELGSPEKVAAIIKANVPGSRIPPHYQTGAPGQRSAAAGAAQYGPSPRYQAAGVAGAPGDSRIWVGVLIAVAALILSPLWLSALGTVFGLLLAVVITALALAFSGAAAVIVEVVVVVKGFLSTGAGLGTALLVAGLGLLDIALGFVLLGVGLALCMLLVWLWRLTVRGVKWTMNKIRGNGR